MSSATKHTVNDSPPCAELSGFKGVLRKVALQELLQLECLGRKSSILEVTTPKVRGRVFILDGSIIHAESGTMDGEVALYSILGLRGGNFDLLPFAAPPKHTISGHWEFLLMEAARLFDEAGDRQELEAPEPPPELPGGSTAAEEPLPGPAKTGEIVLCSAQGEVLFSLNCDASNDRAALLSYIQQQADDLSALAPTGELERLQVWLDGERFLVKLARDSRVLVRTNARRKL